MVNRRQSVYYKNIVYVGAFCNGMFNGYVTWLNEIGKAFFLFFLTIIYTEINEVTKKRFEEYFVIVW